MNQWNLSIQDRSAGLVADANYLGNNTIHMITTENVILPSTYRYWRRRRELHTQWTESSFTVVPGAACST